MVERHPLRVASVEVRHTSTTGIQFRVMTTPSIRKALTPCVLELRFEHMLLNVVADTDPNGIWRFGSLSDFLTNNPAKFQGGIASTLSPRNLRQTIFGAYLQDDWRVKPNLTLNLGLRYEMSTVIRRDGGEGGRSGEYIGC